MTTPASPTTGVQLLDVPPELAGQRIDNFLIARLKGAPKTLIYRILRKGEVRVNKGRIDYRLQAGDQVRRRCAWPSVMSRRRWRRGCWSGWRRRSSTRTRR